MPPRLFKPCVVATVGLALLAASCSSPDTTKPTVVIPTTNKGLCKLVSPSVISTALEESMSVPETLTSGSKTECVYRTEEGTGAAVLILYETRSSASAFDKSRENFEQRGLQLGPITDLGDQAYYFSSKASKSTVTTVAVMKGSLQLLVTGSATLDQIGSIARYTLSEFEAKHSLAPSSN